MAGDEYLLSVSEDRARLLRWVMDEVVSMVRTTSPRRTVLYPTMPSHFIEGILLSEITPASNTLSGATTFTFYRLVPDGSVKPQTNPLTLAGQKNSNGDFVELTGVNRDTTLSADAGAYIHLKRINGEWRPSPVSDVCPE